MVMGTMEVEVDERQRISLGKVIDKSVRRLRVEQLSGGELLLTPVVSLSQRELSVLADPERVATIRQGLEEAELGKVRRYGPGYFTRLAEELDLEDN